MVILTVIIVVKPDIAMSMIVRAVKDKARMGNVSVGDGMRKVKLKSMPRMIPTGAVSSTKVRVSMNTALVT